MERGGFGKRRRVNKEGKGKDIRSRFKKVIDSAEGSAAFLHRITMPTAWRGVWWVVEEVEGDVQPLIMKRGEEAGVGSALAV